MNSSLGLRSLERWAAPLDVGRAWLMSAALRVPLLGDKLRRRDERVPLLLTLHALAAFVLAVLCPSLLLVVGPIVLGVAHLASDVRYLVVRQRLASAYVHVVWLGCAGLFALRSGLGALYRPLVVQQAELGLFGLWLLSSAVMGLRGGNAAPQARLRASVVVLLTLALAWLAATRTATVYLALAHLHNLVALGLWLWLFRQRVRSVWLPLTLVLGCSAWLLSGQLTSTTLRHGVVSSFGLHVLGAADTLAPNLSAAHAVGLTCAYAFLQSVHYAVWLVLIPQDQTRAQGTLTFKMSLRSFFADFGNVAALAVVGLILTVLMAGLIAPLATQRAYLSIAFFHGYLELAIAAFLWVRGKPSTTAGSEPQQALAASSVFGNNARA